MYSNKISSSKDYEYQEGVFLEELKNRFLCMVMVNNQKEICYMPSSCKMSNFIDLDNRKVILQRVKGNNTRTGYSVFAIEYNNKYIPINLAGINRIIELNILDDKLAFLGEREKVSCEKTIDGYKSDLYIEDTNTIIEVKTVLSLKKYVSFPTVYSQRAIRQLNEIKELLKRNHKVCYLVISLYYEVSRIYLNDNQMEYTKLLKECINDGMVLKAFSVKMEEVRILLDKEIEIYL